MNDISKTIEKMPDYLLIAVKPLAIIFAALIAGFIIRKIIRSRLAKWRKGADTESRDIATSVIDAPFIIWFLMLGIYLALEFSKLPSKTVDVVGKILLVLGILSITLVLTGLSAAMTKRFSHKFESVMPITSLTQNITRIIVFGIGILIILNTLGISITPILATLGVGGLAVALALQDTLGNMFAGFHIIMSRQIKIGDYVKLDSGEEGYISDITWRSTAIKTLSNSVILIPNEKLVKVVATNYYLPDREIAVTVDIGVHYNSDLNKVEKVTCQAAKEIMKETKGGVPEFEPFIRFKAFGDSSINFTVILRAKEFTDQYLVKHEFIKKLHKRYAEEGIIIPYPIRAINYEQEGAK